jgi:hypothetical protein
MGLDPPLASSQSQIQPSHSALALGMLCGKDCPARPGSRQRSRSRGADQTSIERPADLDSVGVCACRGEA